MANSRLCSIPDCGKPHLARGWCNAHWLRWSRYGDPLAGGTYAGEPLKYFNEVVLPYTGDDCLIWPYGKTKGYGVVWIGDRTHYVSRLVCEHENGSPTASNDEASHSCGKGHLGCVTRNHLRWATPKENTADKRAHNTHLRGEKTNGAKLTEADVIKIRSMRGELSQGQLAKRFNVTQGAISRIQSRKVWDWL